MKYECQNCGRKAEGAKLPPVDDPQMRFEPGDVYTDRQCAKCGALCYPLLPPPPEPELSSPEIELEVQKIHDSIARLSKRLKRQDDVAVLEIESARNAQVTVEGGAVFLFIGGEKRRIRK
jgi:hypothetical protein